MRGKMGSFEGPIKFVPGPRLWSFVRKWDRSKGQLSFPRSAKVTGKENNYQCADSASTTVETTGPSDN